MTLQSLLQTILESSGTVTTIKLCFTANYTTKTLEAKASKAAWGNYIVEKCDRSDFFLKKGQSNKKTN
jgi:hypothetical protein